MIKISDAGLKRKIKALKSLFRNTPTRKRILKNIGELSVDLIYKRTKAGYGVDNDTKRLPKKNRLKGLSKNYMKRRRKVRLGKFGGPRKSNLTLTGQMLEALKYKLEGLGVKVFIDNSNRNDGKTNDEIADYVRKERPFLALTDKEQKTIFKTVSGMVRSVLRKL